MKRRDFLKAGALACAAGLVPLTACTPGEPAQTGAAPGAERAGQTGQARQWGLVIDVEKLARLGIMDKIAAACHRAHNVPQIDDPATEVKWIWEEDFEHAFAEMDGGAHLPERFRALGFPVLCNHCDEPPCVRVCPTQATFKRADGIVSMDYHRCIGCRFCMSACPYGARSLNFSDPRPYLEHVDPAYPTRSKGVVEKCLLCSERIEKGQAPLCAEASEGAILFGDMDDPDSEVRRALAESFSIRRRVELGTGPNVYYLVKEGEGRA